MQSVYMYELLLIKAYSWNDKKSWPIKQALF